MTLSDKIEALEGPSREVDAEIAGTEVATAMWHSEDETPRYTANIDAAMSLVVGTPYICLEVAASKKQQAHCRIETYDKRSKAKGATPALALCAAALRARQG